MPKPRVLDFCLSNANLQLVVVGGKVERGELREYCQRIAKEIRHPKRLVYAAAGLSPKQTTLASVHWKYRASWSARSPRLATVLNGLKSFGKWLRLHASPLSLLLSLIVYTASVNLAFAISFLALLGIHELGHKWAAKQVGIKTGEPFFWPYVGALITMKEVPKSAWEEAVLGIGGPLIGSLAAVAFLYPPIFGWGNATFWYVMAMIGVAINLFNLLPVRPLDGGRVLGILSHWIMVPGFLVLGYIFLSPLIVQDGSTPSLLWGVLLIASAWEFQRARKQAKEQRYLSRVPMLRRLGMAGIWFVLVCLLAGLLYVGFPVLRDVKDMRLLVP